MKFFNLSLRGRIYISMLALILISLLVIGITTIVFFNDQNKDYHEKRLKRKENTVIMSLRNFFQDLELNENMDIFMKEFNDEILELSNVNRINEKDSLEINIFNLNGQILMSSKYDYSDTAFYKTKIEAAILKNLQETGNRQVQQLNDNYISTYTYVKNKNNKNIVIINIPYDTKLSPEKNELKLFLTTLIKIYIFLLFGASLIAYFLSNYITKSLRVISEKLKLVKINKVNDSIEWVGKDEIGAIVKEYNNMIIKLEESALKLAKSERESAWREMAKQVAHEIKNPLTPIRLSIQHLERSLDPNSPDFKSDLSRFSKKIIQQIDTLTSIANEFSRFAQMPKFELKKVDLTDIIFSTVELYKDLKTVKLKIETSTDNSAFIQGDKEQLTRVFNNLLNNAIQSIPDNIQGEIIIVIKSEKEKHIVAVTDNGKGMDESVKKKIFQPNFTTKSTGTGLGLAMVKQIIDSHKGDIYFNSTLGSGTSFFIEFPKTENESTN